MKTTSNQEKKHLINRYLDLAEHLSGFNNQLSNSLSAQKNDASGESWGIAKRLVSAREKYQESLSELGKDKESSLTHSNASYLQNKYYDTEVELAEFLIAKYKLNEQSQKIAFQAKYIGFWGGVVLSLGLMLCLGVASWSIFAA